ncbi:MAG: DUF72 domain-containing protein [Oligoflexales bacterium]
MSLGNNIRIGISGWTYEPWKGKFYPEDLPATKELEYASRQFNSLEINGTFYALQKPATFAKWYQQTPEDFCFAVKANRYITHTKRAKEARKPVAHFLTGALCLKEKLGPILWQFPPTMKLKDDRFDTFFEILPRTVEEAIKLVQKENEFFPEFDEYLPSLKKLHKKPLQHAFEFRHESFFTPTFVENMARQGVGLVLADSNGKWPYSEDVTANFVYVRLHGHGKIYEGGYPTPVLKEWTKKVRAWQEGKKWPHPQVLTKLLGEGVKKDVFVYFDNDAKVEAPFNAKELTQLVTKRRSTRVAKASA